MAPLGRSGLVADVQRAFGYHFSRGKWIFEWKSISLQAKQRTDDYEHKNKIYPKDSCLWKLFQGIQENAFAEYLG